MDIVDDLALIDLLCARDLPAEHGGTDAGMGGPGYRIVPLGPDDWESPDDCYAYEAAVAERLTARHGEPARWGTATLGERMARGEDISEPWATLGALAYELRAWEAKGTGRWVALAVADRDADEQPRLWVAVTDVNPP
ncbi:hypothetical protein J7F01_38695 [Streptomyces sp. ISL-22]|uniref:hypothetical protein n=1 Tax=unclassified Streptomyces TaxID=2593676 RepID=UPI001BEA402D|nr:MULTISPECIES: hypothetical protein [unclassified Streptomyces]MBT2420520.1 hypothetical protein [Streptomyces sp. ISL-24]MBT2437959.1 hypothetical protein [Streptomyces sp. ISL-22]